MSPCHQVRTYTRFCNEKPLQPLKKGRALLAIASKKSKKKKAHKLTDAEVKVMERQVTANQAARGSALYKRIENRSKLGGMRAMRGRINPNR